MSLRNGGVRLLPIEYGTFRADIRRFFTECVLVPGTRVMDPMAGTAPFIPHVETRGLAGHFNDILPVHYHINRAKTRSAFQGYLNMQDRDAKGLLREAVSCMQGLGRLRLLVSKDWVADG